MRNWQAKLRPHWTHWIEIFLAAAVVGVAAAVGMAQIYIYNQQAEIMGTQAEIAQKQADIMKMSERAYITIDSPNLSIPDKAITLPLSNTGRIPSGNIQAIVHAATFNSQISNNFNLETGAPAELGWRRHSISPLPPGKDLITVAIPLPEFAEAKYTPQGVFQIILVVGRVAYGDGFPDDGAQEWPFCYQTVYHTSLKKIFLVSCDAAHWLPVLEKRDGYPNNEQRD